ncbi:hypothetical protein SAMN05444162_4022 [Paenibacillaceae bacterium GAS479]|nr:hypothetical protein SAMN05444162_4022 [Paenibacillaceae bacterium GAS479]
MREHAWVRFVKRSSAMGEASKTVASRHEISLSKPALSSKGGTSMSLYVLPMLNL